MNPRRLFLKSLGAAFPLLFATGSRSDEPAKTEKPNADSMLGKEPGQVRDDNGLKMKLVWCPPGEFTMEQVDVVEEVEKIAPVKVILTRGYWLGKYVVTQAEWKRVMATEPWKGQPLTKEGDDFPATFVSWDDAMEYCRKLTKQERKSCRLPDEWKYTLPTEAQWEHGCRAGTETKFSFGDDESKLGEYAWFLDNAWNAGEPYAHRVGQKKPNLWGLYDMHGNVDEWCRDWYSDKLPGGRDPEMTEVTAGSFRVIRGGGWSAPPAYCRSACHNGVSSARSHFGFRVVLVR